MLACSTIWRFVYFREQFSLYPMTCLHLGKKQMLESSSGLARISSSDSTTPTRSSPRSPRSSESGSNSGSSERRSKRDTERQEAAAATANDNAAAAASADGNTATAKIPNATKWTVSWQILPYYYSGHKTHVINISSVQSNL